MKTSQRKSLSTANCQVVLFDLDGTLAESMGEGLKTANRLRHLFGYEELNPNDERLRRISGKALISEVLGLGPLRGLLWGIVISCIVKIVLVKNGSLLAVYLFVTMVQTSIHKIVSVDFWRIAVL
jgi:hypothetical protein